MLNSWFWSLFFDYEKCSHLGNLYVQILCLIYYLTFGNHLNFLEIISNENFKTPFWKLQSIGEKQRSHLYQAEVDPQGIFGEHNY